MASKWSKWDNSMIATQWQTRPLNLGHFFNFPTTSKLRDGVKGFPRRHSEIFGNKKL